MLKKNEISVYSEIFDFPLPPSADGNGIAAQTKLIGKIREICGNAAPTDEDLRACDRGFCGGPDFREIFAEERAPYHLRENRREPNQLEWFWRFLTCLREEGAAVTVVVPPMREDYRNLLPSKEELFRALEEFPDVRIADFYDDASFAFSDFRDPDHLNGDGARKLSQKLAEMLKAEENKER